MTNFNSQPLGVCAALLVTAMVPSMATAQPMVQPLELFGTLGVGQAYLDTTVFDHSAAGGGARFRFSRRFAFQGDLLAIRWNDPGRREEARYGHEHTRVGSLTIVGIDPSTSRAVRLYWLAGVSAPLNGSAAPPVMPTIGFGTRISLSDRYFVAPEARLLSTSLFRFSVSGGIALGSR